MSCVSRAPCLTFFFLIWSWFRWQVCGVLCRKFEVPCVLCVQVANQTVSLSCSQCMRVLNNRSFNAIQVRKRRRRWRYQQLVPQSFVVLFIPSEKQDSIAGCQSTTRSSNPSASTNIRTVMTRSLLHNREQSCWKPEEESGCVLCEIARSKFITDEGRTFIPGVTGRQIDSLKDRRTEKRRKYHKLKQSCHFLLESASSYSS